jgi:hypothetical protein
MIPVASLVPDGPLELGIVIIFLIFLILVAVSSFPLIRQLYGLYNRMATYHKLPDDYPSSSKGERLSHKISYVIRDIVIVQLIATSVALIYLPFFGGMELISIESAVGLGLIISTVHISFRHAAFNELGIGGIKESFLDGLRSQCYKFGFGFMLTLYFLSLIGIGVSIINGQILSDVSEINFIENIYEGIFLVVFFLGVPVVFVVISEYLLAEVFGVPDELKTDTD